MISSRRFRPPCPVQTAPAPASPALDLEAVMDLIDSVWLPVHFYLDRTLKLTWEFTPSTEVPWEHFKGRLLESHLCRETRVMARWDIFQVAQESRSEEPLICVLLDFVARTIHVLRGIPTFRGEAESLTPETGNNESPTRWLRESVGSLSLSDCSDLEEVRDELICLLWQACVGTGRLPLTSAETPLPVYSFGLLHFVFRSDWEGDKQDPEATRPMRSWSELLAKGWPLHLKQAERAKLLEFLIRCTPLDQISQLAAALALQTDHGLGLLRRMMNDVSLSPFTDFVSKVLLLIDGLVRCDRITVEDQIEFLAHLLKLHYRHLLAYDLVVFHHRGANYPDALLLEEVLPRYAALLSTVCRPRENLVLALVLGCLLVYQYQQHAVPDAPTSHGENARVMPDGGPRVPIEQIDEPHRRKRRLFADWDWKKRIGEDACTILRNSPELLPMQSTFLELGTAIFIDRSFGKGKPSLEPDQTLLLAHEAFSRTLAKAALHRWRALLCEVGREQCKHLDPLQNRGQEELNQEELNQEEWNLTGIPIQEIATPDRPVPSLSDAARVAPDFLVVRTLPGSVRAFLREYGPMIQGGLPLTGSLHFVGRVVTEQGSSLLACGCDGTNFRFEVDASQGFRTRAGLEVPRAGFRSL